MITAFFSHEISSVNESKADKPVLLYGYKNETKHRYAIGNPCYGAVSRLYPSPEQNAFDFFTIALSVIAADKFILRENGVHGFNRDINAEIEIASPQTWTNVKYDLEKTLNFLTGDQWTLTFSENGMGAPKRNRSRKINLNKADCVCLFSGGLDSFIGAADLIKKGQTPILVSRKGVEGQHQDYLAQQHFSQYPRVSLNDCPRGPNHEISTRSRSFLFLALGALACSALSRLKRGDSIPLYMPENGFIALNPPLTSQRLGANSTRTAHPFYLESLQSIFKEVGIPAEIKNPFEHFTKGEMLKQLIADSSTFRESACQTVSCGHWKRNNQQCGYCVPCIIRRSAFHTANIADKTNYKMCDLRKFMDTNSKLDGDIRAFQQAISAFKKDGEKCRPIRSIRNVSSKQKYYPVLKKGFREIETFLKSQGVSV